MNCAAALVCLSSAGILTLSFQATPAGAGLDAAALVGTEGTTIAAVPTTTSTGGVSSEELEKHVHHAVQGSKVALQLHIALLEVGKHRLQALPDYSATFFKQERVDGGDLQELQTCQLRLRHKPFSVYMKWIEGGDVGRELLFVDGEYENRMQIKLGGRKGDLLPRLKLDPNGSVAMAESRHPVTEMGLLQLAELTSKFRKRDLELKEGVRWQLLADQKVLERDCHGFVVEYASKEVEPTYRKSITFIDKEHSLPVCVKNFGWPAEDLVVETPQALDEATLIEFYGYRDLQFETRLSENAFDKANSEYKFRR